MHARVVTLSVRQGNVDHVLRIMRETVMPAAARQEGFNAFILMSNQKASKVIATSYWETETEMLASEKREYFQEQISRVITFLSAPPTIEHYEVNALS